MPRANRHFLPGHIWHITHRCHKQEFLLKFSRDRSRWIHWLYEARKRYGLCVVNYVVTSNHIHLLVRDTDEHVIQKSMQLIAGRTAQEYNLRKNRRGAYWEDRYHATAIQSGSHLFRCLVYIDLNMVRAGVVKHPIDWLHGGYHAIQNPPKRYRILDYDALCELSGVSSLSDYQGLHRAWVAEAIKEKQYLTREAHYSEALAIGNKDYLEELHSTFGISHRSRDIEKEHDCYCIKEPASSYISLFRGKTAALRVESASYFDKNN
jgi:putative transposase